MDKVTDGLKHDGGKPRLDLVPPEIIEAVGAVMTHGAEKYGEGSYRNVEPKRYRAALMRHICQWLRDPYGIDEDSGLPHIYHIACNVAFLLEIDKERDVINEVDSVVRCKDCVKRGTTECTMSCAISVANILGKQETIIAVGEKGERDEKIH